MKYLVKLLKIVIPIALLIGGFYLLVYLNLNSLKEDLESNAKKENKQLIELFKNDLTKYLIENRHNKLKELMNKIISMKYYNQIELYYDRYLFTQDALTKDLENGVNNSWLLGDVTIDTQIGEINNIKSDLYELIPNNSFDLKQKMVIKFQALKNNSVENQVAGLFFQSHEYKSEHQNNKMSDSWEIKLDDIDFSLVYENIHFAAVKIKVSDDYLYKILEDRYDNIIFYYLLTLFVLIAISLILYKFIYLNMLIKPLSTFNIFIENSLKNSFQKVEIKDSYIPTYEKIGKNLDKLSRKMASIINELNVNRDMIERKISTDDLTGLSNQKVFELDMKGMFVASIKGYVCYLKLEPLQKFAKERGSAFVNNLIEDFAHTIQNSISHYGVSNITLYRFYGSEFAIIAKRVDGKTIENLSKEILTEIKNKMAPKYEINESITHIGITHFDLYGNIDSILNSSKDAYEHAKEIGDNEFYIVNEDDANNKLMALESKISSIIKNNLFSVNFATDTYLMEHPQKLYMQELVPDLKDEDGNIIPIGTFISIAEKISLAPDFDKLIIKKAMEFLKLDSVEHKIAVNLSSVSIADTDFMTWLEAELLYHEELKDKIIFSITSFAASLNFELFKNFVTRIHENESKVILKRYNYNEISLEKLEGIHIDYIRIHKDYTNGVALDKQKKQVVKNIIIFGDLNDIVILGDNVKSKDDFELLDKLGLFGTSR